VADKKTVVLAFSGGLDTSFCAVWLREELGADVVPVTVDTGGFSRGERARLTARASALTPIPLVWRDARHTLFNEFILPLLYGNCLKGGVYPYCVAAERSLQTREVARVAREIGASAVAHGSTGAGNDQVRMDGILKAIAPDLDILTPVRDLRISREQETAYLQRKGIRIEDTHRAFSINRGMWGTTCGNRALQNEKDGDAFDSLLADRKPPGGRFALKIALHQGRPVAVNHRKMSGPRLVEWLNREGGRRGVGIGLHTGTTALGIKGRIAFEAPAAVILIRAHHELEKVVLTRDELFWKGVLAEVYGDFLHRGLYLHPLLREIEAFLTASQHRVTGVVSGFLSDGEARFTAVNSPFSLFAAPDATYGERAAWSSDFVKGFIQFHNLETIMSHRQGGGADGSA
jgi:argininosuccinate synthase